MNVTHVFFDLDGTLTDPGPGITGGVLYALEQFGISVQDRTQLYSFIGPPLLDSFREEYGFNEEQSHRALKYYRKYFEKQGIFENAVYEGIPCMLDTLKKAGKKLVLATSKPEIYAKRIMDHFDLSRYFMFQAGSLTDEQRSKKAEVIAYAIESCRIQDLSSVIMVGDRKHDIIGAKTCGLASLGVLYGYGSRKELKDAGADHIAETVQEVGDILLSLQ